MVERRRAVEVAVEVGVGAGLVVEDAVVLQDSNKLTLRLVPCDVLARVAPVGEEVAGLEVDVARGLARVGSPVAALDPRVEPRVHERDGFVVTFWTYYEVGPAEVGAAEYGRALGRLHAGMRRLDVVVPHFTERVERARGLLADRERTPELAEEDRELLAETLGRVGRVTGRREQLLHGEPHPGNVLATKDGVRFIDLETCCRGPVEFDLAHAPEAVAAHYAGADPDLLRDCRLLVLAMATTWRWERGDRLPGGRRLAAEWLSWIRQRRRW